MYNALFQKNIGQMGSTIRRNEEKTLRILGCIKSSIHQTLPLLLTMPKVIKQEVMEVALFLFIKGTVPFYLEVPFTDTVAKSY